MDKNTKLYCLTHWEDADGVGCKALIKLLDTSTTEYGTLRTYNKLPHEMKIVQKKLEDGYTVIISDICFYKKEMQHLLSDLVKKYTDRVIVLDHHEETVQLLIQLATWCNIGYSMLSITEAASNHSAVYITMKFLEKLGYNLPLPTVKLVECISNLDTFNFTTPEDNETIINLQYYFIGKNRNDFIRLFTQDNWKNIITDFKKTSTFKKIKELEDKLLTTAMRTYKNNICIINFTNQDISAVDGGAVLSDISELICYKMCMRGKSVLCIDGTVTVVYKGNGCTNTAIMRALKLPYGRNRNKVSFLTINIYKHLLEGASLCL